ncbi:MAG: cytochrome B [Hyphomicrobiales bacterium]|nr:MAG: cytochrome B [Hyphomicrobiales bacterium]
MSAAELDAGRTTRPATVRVWDPLVRIFHWGLVATFAIAYITGDEWQKVHEPAGYVVMGLIAFRILWGFVGTRHARFSKFVYRPSTVLGFMKDTIGLRAKRYIGHNPAGGAMVIALLIALAAISATGFMMTTDAYWGVEWVEEAHEAAVNITLGLVVLHVIGVVVASIEHGENLARAMVTGRKRPE